jgi:tetratricopeptide (TPR) repeat protein
MLLLVLLAATPSADDVARAKVLYQSGKTHYELQNYSEAIRDFAAGYALSPKPEFLINLGQAYRASGDKQKAVEMYERYLERAPADAKPRKQIEALIVELKAELAQAPPADAPKKEPTVTPTEPVAPAPVVVARAEEKPSAAVWAVPLGIGVAVAAGVATALAIGFSNSVSCNMAPSLGCVDLRQR